MSIAHRLHGASQSHGAADPANNGSATGDQEGNVDEALQHDVPGDFPPPQTYSHGREFGDQFINLLYGPWEGDESTLNLESILQTDDPVSLSNFNYLGRSL